MPPSFQLAIQVFICLIEPVPHAALDERDTHETVNAVPSHRPEQAQVNTCIPPHTVCNRPQPKESNRFVFS